MDYVWKVDRIDCHPKVGKTSDVVHTVALTITGNDGTYSDATATSVGITVGSGPFKALSKLTHDEVLGWARAALGTAGVAQIEDEIAQRLANRHPVSTPDLPWEAVAE